MRNVTSNAAGSNGWHDQATTVGVAFWPRAPDGETCSFGGVAYPNTTFPRRRALHCHYAYPNGLLSYQAFVHSAAPGE
jgi:hypothetical protein